MISFEKFISQSSNFSIYIHDYNVLSCSIDFNLDFGKDLKYCEDCNAMILNTFETKGEILIYTDGSKIPSNLSVGTALICPSLGIQKCNKVFSLASIFTAEYMAINDALDITLKNKDHIYNIFTDCLSVLQSLKSPRIDAKLNPYILQIKKKFIDFQKEIHQIT